MVFKGLVSLSKRKAVPPVENSVDFKQKLLKSCPLQSLMRNNKLVRDKIPEIIEKEGKLPVIHIANEQEYSLRLKEKLMEEVQEFLSTPNAEELVDILEVIHALAKLEGLSSTQLEQQRQKKANERGTFSKRIVLDRVISKTTS